ncbi:iron-containing alcohol dehydrogenase family protein [Enterococcus faecalis]
MNQSLIVRGGPQEYECKIGAWTDLELHLNRRNIQRVLVLHGEQSWQVAAPFFPKFKEVQAVFEPYGGQCTDQRIQEVIASVHQQKSQAIIAVGGGTVSDLGKAVAHRGRVPIIILPTLAATCAAWTPLSVIYQSNGAMDRYEVFPTANALVLLEPRVILASPISLMIAGIGDTLAKWYEADAMISQLSVASMEIQVAAFAAKKCRDILLEDSLAAIGAMQTQTLNQAFLNVIETNIFVGGMVGGFGDDYGRTAGAHSIHDALTILPQSHQQLHGNKVAYGVLVQLVIEEKWQEIEFLLPFYQQIGLPISLKAMKMDHISAEDLQAVAERACAPGETIFYMKETITPKVVADAMQRLEQFVLQSVANQ